MVEKKGRAGLDVGEGASPVNEPDYITNRLRAVLRASSKRLDNEGEPTPGAWPICTIFAKKYADSLGPIGEELAAEITVL